MGIFERIASFENLLAAYRLTRQGKRGRLAMVLFEERREENLWQIHRDLISGSYDRLPYASFSVRDPKPRRICASAVRDRVLDRGIGRIVEPFLELQYAAHSYGSRPGRGTSAALDHACRLSKTFRFCLRTDIVKYFASIDHSLLLVEFGRRFPDQAFLQLLATILRSFTTVEQVATPYVPFAGDAPEDADRRRGLVLGSHLSQIAANLYLERLDHWAAAELAPEACVRYCDDLLFFADRREDLEDAAVALRERLAGLRLRLHPDKTHIVATCHGFPFLGHRILPDRMLLLRRNVKRFNARRRELRDAYAAGEIHMREVRAAILSWKGHAAQGHTATLCHTLLDKVRFYREENLMKLKSTAQARWHLNQAQRNDSPIFRKSYDLMGVVFEETVHMERRVRGSMARRLENATFDLEEALVDAARAQGDKEIGYHLQRADNVLARMSRWTRRAADCRLLSLKAYMRISNLASEVGCMLGSWKKTVEASNPRPSRPRSKATNPKNAQKETGQQSLFPGEVT